MAEGPSEVVTLLFTDVVGSTELLSRRGDERAQLILGAHRDLLTAAVAGHWGQEVKWLGDGLMVAFPSAADAVRCAIAMQRESRRPLHGERLALRVGLSTGEVLREAADYFGTPVVVARRLCEGGERGQIVCTDVVAKLLAGRSEFGFAALGKIEVHGLPDPVVAFEVRYEERLPDLPRQMPFVGREPELRRLSQRLAEAAAGRGGVVMVAGEPGIGKTRLAEELARRGNGTLVLRGQCFESEWRPPYGPFAEAIATLTEVADADELRADLGPGAAPIAQLVPRVREVLSDLPDPVPVEAGEERFRLLEAVAQLLIARSRRRPVLLFLDDLHWADKGTVAMVRHLARFVSQHRILLVGAYRDVEVDRGHPLAEVLGGLQRETAYERIRVAGFQREEVAELVTELVADDVADSVVSAIAEETDGNPLFIRELLWYLVQEGKIYRGPDGRWTSDRSIADLGIPEGLREAIRLRLSHLSDGANRFLSVASAFEGPFRFDVVASIAGVGEQRSLDALDEAFAAQILEPAGDAEAYDFTHALIRHTIYSDLTPSRQIRLHRRVAEALEAALGSHPSPAEAGHIASQYHRSATLAGAERGVDFALRAAGHAEATGAHDEAARFLRMALGLLLAGDARRPHLLGRLAIALAWAREFDEAVRVATEAGDSIAAAVGEEAATEYLADATQACAMAGSSPHSWALARLGLEHAGDRRDIAWAHLLAFDYERRAAEDPQHPGIPLDTPERWEAARILRAAPLDPMGPGPTVGVLASRSEALASTNLVVLIYWAGDYARALPLLEAEAQAALSRGQFFRAGRCWSLVADCLTALGRLDEARPALGRAQALAARLGQPIFVALNAQDRLNMALDEGWEQLVAILEPLAAAASPPFRWALGYLYGALTRSAARQDQNEIALHFLDLLVPWLEHAPAWTISSASMRCDAAETLWLLERLDHVEVIEASLREKVVAPDFRAPMMEGRLALARLCALQHRYGEALLWFAEARTVLEDQGARPLRAIADYDEALMYVRRGDRGDAELAPPLLDAAVRQFEAIGMTGWIRRAEQLRTRLDEQ